VLKEHASVHLKLFLQVAQLQHIKLSEHGLGIKDKNYSHVIFGEPQLLMTQGTRTSLMEHLRQVPDPRIERTRRHELMDLLVIALCAAIDVADN